jgi:hypothetical protein
VLGALVRRRALVVAALLLAATPASAFGFSKAVWGPVYRNGVNQFPIYQRLGASIYEAQLNWRSVAPTQPRDAVNPADPAYRWPANIGQARVQARRFHMQVLLMLVGTPSWANGGRDWNWVPNHRADFAAFATAAARRYPSVHLWMIWGEPSRVGNFQPLVPAPPGARLDPSQQVAPHIYARMLDAAYAALKRVSSRNLVIGGCTYTTGDISTAQWIENLRLPSGQPPRMDMYAHNPFSWRHPSFHAAPSPAGEIQFPDLPRLATIIDRYLRPGLPIFISEWTIPTQIDEEFGFYVDPPVAARWVTDGLRLARGWSRIFGLGWVHVYDIPPVSYGGLIDEHGVRKPLFDAFARG